jgi:hypothetical protein
VSLISINHLFRFSENLTLPTALCGVLYLLALVLSLVYASRRHIKESTVIFLIFICIGWLTKPYLEPPGDPVEHLGISYSTCNKSSAQIPRSNGGLWHYSMTGLFLCGIGDGQKQPPQVQLNKIRAIHSGMVGLLAAGVFAVGKAAGMPPFWSLFSVVLAFLFFGTNRFSFFSYYSFADSSTSLFVYWLWTAVFFFRKNRDGIFEGMGIISVVILYPVLYVNHIQEALFLAFMALVWLVITASEAVLANQNRRLNWFFFGTLLLVFFVLPQFQSFQSVLAKYFIINDWEKNQALVVTAGPLHFMGKIWSYRINDTLGLMGFLAVPAAILILVLARNEPNRYHRYRVAIVGILPFLVYCLPLLNFIWLSNCKWLPTHTRYYYRMCYSSMFWVSIAYLFFMIEQRLQHLPVMTEKSGYRFGTFKRVLIKHYGVLVLTGFICLGAVRSAPVYGKLDFLTVNTNPWWPQWRPMIEAIHQQPLSKMIYTDAMTRYVINNVFNYPVYPNYIRKRPEEFIDLDSLPSNKRLQPLVNLIGFEPSWVPIETRHWRPIAGNTQRFYQYKSQRGRHAAEMIRRYPPPGIPVYH